MLDSKARRERASPLSGEGKCLANYMVFACPKCKLIRYAKEGQKTAKCVGCGHQIQLNPYKIKVLARAKNVREATELVKLFKIKAVKKRGFSHLKTPNKMAESKKGVRRLDG